MGALVAAGDGREKEEQQQHRVPVYGEIVPPLDEDELAAASLSPDFATLDAISIKTSGVETVLCQTKQRYSRLHKGNPKEQEEEWRQGEYLKVHNDDEALLEHKFREV